MSDTTAPTTSGPVTDAQLDALAAKLTEIEAREYAKSYPGSQHKPETVVWKEGAKYVRIDFQGPASGSGAWMVERATGEIFNIMGYGKIDKNKKQKADIGNVHTVDPERMHKLRYNYLR